MLHRSSYHRHLLPIRFPHSLHQQRATLVNVKLKWIKDRTLDHVVSREKHLRPLLHLLHLLQPQNLTICTHDLTHPSHNPNLLLRYPAIFTQSSPTTFTLTPSALFLRRLHLHTLSSSEPDLVLRLRKLLMLTIDRSLPLHTVNLLRFDLGLEPDFERSLLPRYPQFFSTFQPAGDERVWIKLEGPWDPQLAVSELRRRNPAGDDSFPVRFTRGFGLRRKCVEWLREWQTLPYVSPYEDSLGLDPRTDLAEKRMVGVFHEMLHLMVGKKTERRNVSNMRRVLGLPYKFTKVFERHPGIFYLSRKLGTETVVLREGYGGGREVLERNPIVEVREKWLELMRVRREDMENDDDEEDRDDCVEEYDSCSESRIDEELNVKE